MKESLMLAAANVFVCSAIFLGVTHTLSPVVDDAASSPSWPSNPILAVGDPPGRQPSVEIDGRFYALPVSSREPSMDQQVQWVEEPSGWLAIVIPTQGPARFYRVPTQTWLDRPSAEE